MHRKYHRGRYRQGQWVLGMVERGTNLTMMVPVESRDAGTLLPIIQQYVLPGTHIITDRWRAYNALPNHFVLEHKYTFVDPNDPIVHTNTIEGAWSTSKVKLRAMRGGTSSANFSSYPRRRVTRNFFDNMMYWIRHYYAV